MLDLSAKSSEESSLQLILRIYASFQDVDPACVSWAQHGECTKNPGYMMGTTGSGIGSCRLSCRACEICSPKDQKCKNRNRVKDGFLPLEDVD